MLGPCANDSHEFFQAIENCLINDPNFDLTRLIVDTKNLNHSHVILEPSFIRVKNTYHHLEDEIWSITYHETFGPCHRADLTKSKIHQSAKVGDHIYVGFAFVTNVSWALSRIFLHSEDNFPDSAQLNPLSMYRGKGQSNYSSRYKREGYQSLRSMHNTYAFKENQPRRGGFGGSYRSAKKQSKDPKRG